VIILKARKQANAICLAACARHPHPHALPSRPECAGEQRDSFYEEDGKLAFLRCQWRETARVTNKVLDNITVCHLYQYEHFPARHVRLILLKALIPEFQSLAILGDGANNVVGNAALNPGLNFQRHCDLGIQEAG